MTGGPLVVRVSPGDFMCPRCPLSTTGIERGVFRYYCEVLDSFVSTDIEFLRNVCPLLKGGVLVLLAAEGGA